MRMNRIYDVKGLHMYIKNRSETKIIDYTTAYASSPDSPVVVVLVFLSKPGDTDMLDYYVEIVLSSDRVPFRLDCAEFL